MERLLRKYPHLKAERIIVVRDTTRIPATRLDTVFKYRFDTTIIEKDRLKIRHYYDTVTRTNYLSGECKDTVLIKEVSIPVRTVEYLKPERGKWWESLLMYLVVGMCVVTLITSFKRK